MTDNEIIKALKCCIYGEDGISDCKNCPLKDKECYKFLLSDVLAIINRQQAEKEALIAGQETMSKYIEEQQAEIERLQADNKTFENVIKNTFLEKAGLDIDPLAEVKAEAIKEFVEMLKEKADVLLVGKNGNYYSVSDKDIDNLVKQRVGDTE